MIEYYRSVLMSMAKSLHWFRKKGHAGFIKTDRMFRDILFDSALVHIC